MLNLNTKKMLRRNTINYVATTTAVIAGIGLFAICNTIVTNAKTQNCPPVPIKSAQSGQVLCCCSTPMTSITGGQCCRYQQMCFVIIGCNCSIGKSYEKGVYS